MGRFVLRRLLQLIPVFIGATFLIYFMVWSLPGDPFAAMCGERPCPDAFVTKMREQYNLDENIFVQYFYYLTDLLQGNFGETYAGVSVNELLERRYPVSIRLALIAIIIEAIIGVVAGIMTGLRGRGFLDNLVLVSTLFLISLPVFVTGFVLQIVLGFQLEIISPVVSPEGNWSELIVPGFVLGSLSMAYVARLTRTSIMENKHADFIRTALAKGQPQRRIVGIHMLRNSAIPVLTFIGTDLGSLMGGAIVTEGIFGIPGIGGLIYRSILTKEGATVTSVVVLLVIVFLVINLVVDLLYAILDPRIRYD